jgi:hypothetical protein
MPNIPRVLLAAAILASAVPNVYGQDAKAPNAPSAKTKPKAAAPVDPAADVDWQAVVGKVAFIETARDTEPDMPAIKVLELVQDARTKKIRVLRIESSEQNKDSRPL